MTVRILEDSIYCYYKKGEVKNLPDAIAKELISKGVAVKVPENGRDSNANNALNEARLRDAPNE